jgi:hypothetical protein
VLEQRSPALFYQWQVPGKIVSVSLSLVLVDRLGLEIQEGSCSSPQRGPELGGLLLGRPKRNSGTTVVEIEDFQSVRCEHAVGPSYLLSPTDRQGLKDQIRHYKATRGLSIVGFYRSNTRKEFALTVEDIDLMSAHFAKPSMVLLLIHAAPNARLRAGFSIWEERKIRTVNPYLEFPFHRADLMAGGNELLDRSVAARPAPQTRSVAAPLLSTAPPPLRLPAPSPRLCRLPALPPRVTVELRPVAPAAEASFHRRLPHSTPGRLSSLLRHSWTRFRLQWFAAAAILAGAVVAGVLNRHSVPVATPAPLGSRVAPPHNVSVLTPNPVAPAESAPADAPAETPALTDILGAADRRHDAPQPHVRVGKAEYSAREVSTIPAVPREAREVLPAPPEIAPGLQGDPELPLHEKGLPTPEVSQVPDPFVRVALDPLASRNRGGFLGKIIRNRDKRASFVPPTLVHEALLDVPAGLRQRIQHEVSVAVKLYIDRAGTVEYAELLSDGTGANRDFASLAVFSSRHCEFRPARVGDETVPAEVVLRFQFGPEAH